MRPESEGGAVRGRVVLGLLLWLTAVCGVAGLAWFAIDSAGKSVTALPLSPSGVSEELTPTDGPTTTEAEDSTTLPVVPPASPKPTGLSTGVLSVTTEPAASPTQTPTRTTTTTTTTTTARPPASSPTTPKPVRTRQGNANGSWGSVSASCAGSRLVKVGAVPANGWKVTVTASRTGVSVTYLFDGEEGARATVKVFCADGRPKFDVDSKD